MTAPLTTDRAVTDMYEATSLLAFCMREEAEVAREKALMLKELVPPLLRVPNPLAQPLKDGTVPLHSATSAVAAVKDTPEYAELRRRALETSVATLFARNSYEGARILALGTVKEAL